MKERKSFCFRVIILIFVLGIAFYDWFVFDYPSIESCDLVFVGKVLKVNKGIEKKFFQIVVDYDQRFNILVFSKEGDYGYGDFVRVEGKQEAPENFDDFNYQGYLIGEGIDRIMFDGKIELIEEGHGFLRFINGLKKKLVYRIDRLWPFPESAFLKALLLGDKGDLKNTLKEKLSSAGVGHVFVVSGMHVGIVALVFLKIFNWIGIYRKLSFLLIGFLVFFFVALVGFSASSERAFLMGLLGLLSVVLGRTSSKNFVFLVGALMLLKDPLLLRFSVSFQFSFLAVLAIVYLKNWLFENMGRIGVVNFLNLRDILVATISSWFGTFLLSFFYFKKISLVFILTNILVIPLILYVIMFGWIGILGGENFTFLAWYLIKFLEKIILIFS